MTQCDRNRTYDSDRGTGPVATREELEAALDDLVRTAHANGVRVRGGFGLRHPAPETPDWGVEITRLRKPRVGEVGRREERRPDDARG